MIQKLEKIKEQNQEKIEKNKDSINIQNSLKTNIIINISQNNSIKDNENLNILDDIKNLNIINKEMKNIAATGKSSLSWKELKPYIIYFYEKNVKNFSEKQKNIVELNKVSNEDLHFPFHEKKESKDEQMDLNNSHENNSFDDKNLNLIGDFHLNDENHLIYEDFKLKKENSNIQDTKDENIEKDIIEFINNIKFMPFTIQRIVELLLEPYKYYSTLLKYNRAFYKLVNIDFD